MSDIETIQARLPCSVELPAGCGKTETIARLVAGIAGSHGQSLVLTHTHAGVDALRRRFRRIGVPRQSVSVKTIDSWCYDLIGSFPVITGIAVGPEPDWTQSNSYYHAGQQAVASMAVEKMLRLSYDLLVVDEYQDCSTAQHALVQAISGVLPTCIFGDRMQGIFFFTGESVEWEEDVLPAFPPVAIEEIPWRWKTTNPALGSWLLGVRRLLLNGDAVDLSTGPLELRHDGNVAAACFAQPWHPSRTAVIAKWPRDCARLAQRLAGSYTMIEEIEGRHLLEFAERVDLNNGPATAEATLEFAVSCAFGVAKVFNASSRRQIGRGGGLTGKRFGGLQDLVEAIQQLAESPSYTRVLQVLDALARMPGFQTFRREAWLGICDALRMADVTPDLSLRDAVVSCRNKLRVAGRYPESRIIARPLLIKGLEFDNVVLTDPSEYDAHELYVCLTRAARRLSVVAGISIFEPRRPVGRRAQPTSL